MSQEALAKKAGVSQGTIGNLESGLRRQPRALIQIAAALGVNPAWLASGNGEKRPNIGKSPTDHDLPAALRTVLDALAALPPTRWASVRAQLDLLAAHPEMRDDVLAELRALLTTPSTKRGSSGEH